MSDGGKKGKAAKKKVERGEGASAKRRREAQDGQKGPELRLMPGGQGDARGSEQPLVLTALAEIEALLDQELVDILDGATETDLQLQRLVDEAGRTMSFPADAEVVGESVRVQTIGFLGNSRLGLLANCLRKKKEHFVEFSSVQFPMDSPGHRLSLIYHRWLEYGEVGTSRAPEKPSQVQMVLPDEIEVGEPVELVVMSRDGECVRCRLLGTERELALDVPLEASIPGQIITLRPEKFRTRGQQPIVSGVIEDVRLDIAALGLAPLEVHDMGPWDAENFRRGFEGERLPKWAKEILKKGPRTMYEIESAETPPEDGNWIDNSPQIRVHELVEEGRIDEARKIIHQMISDDLRTISAHHSLGAFEFDYRPEVARQHFLVGIAIGDYALGAEFSGVLPWGFIENRPYLRCLHGDAMCAWRLDDVDHARKTLERLLSMAPEDNQGARFSLDALARRKSWLEFDAECGG